jgi:hypothetical protein
MNRHGQTFLDDLMQAGDLMDFDHTLVVRDADDSR